MNTEPRITVGPPTQAIIVTAEAEYAAPSPGRPGHRVYEVRLDQRPLTPSTARLLAAALVSVADEVDRINAAGDPATPYRYHPRTSP